MRVRVRVRVRVCVFVETSDGWMLYVRANPLCGVCKLVSQCGCACCSHPAWGKDESQFSSCTRANFTALNTHMSAFSQDLAKKTGAALQKQGCEVGRICAVYTA